MLTLQSPFYQLAINPKETTWSLYGRSMEDPSLDDVQMAVKYRLGRSSFHALRPGTQLLAGVAEEISGVHGPLKKVEFRTPNDQNGMRISITFALPQAHPLALLKLHIENRGSLPVYLDRLEPLHTGLIRKPGINPISMLLGMKEDRKFLPGAVRPSPDPGELVFYSNGWQSWSFSGVYQESKRFRRSRLGFLRRPVETGSGTPVPKRRGVFASDMFGILADRENRTGILAGFLSQRQHFGSLVVSTDRYSPVLRMWANGDSARLDPGASVETDWACIHFLELDSPDPLGPYLDAVARENAVPDRVARRDIPTGWCSWYDYYQNISAEAVRRNLQQMAEFRRDIPLEIVQIDDGFESQVGDWYSFSNRFPDGVAPLAAEIRESGFTPGLWLAPFIVHPRSRIARDHPDWILRGAGGLPVNTGFLWNTFPQALDLTVPPALEYAAGVIGTAVHEWGFPYLKLDFLFAAALSGRFKDPTRTRAQVLRAGLEAVRGAAGDEAFLVGCGCPLGPAIGLVDSMRIGTDVEQHWEPSHYNLELPFRGEPAIPSARNAIQNTLVRSPMHRRWWINDPDCLLLREGTRLSEAEVQTLASVIAFSGGALLISDDLSAVSKDRLRVLQALLLPIGKPPQVLDLFDSATPSRLQLDLDGAAGRWHLLALFNWDEEPRDLSLSLKSCSLLPDKEYYARTFWDGSVTRVKEELQLKLLPPHGAGIAALRPVLPGRAVYLGSSLHISQGMELAFWEETPGSLSCRLERPGAASGVVDLAIPKAPASASLNGKPVKWTETGAGIYRFPVDFIKTANLEVTYR